MKKHLWIAIILILITIVACFAAQIHFQKEPENIPYFGLNYSRFSDVVDNITVIIDAEKVEVFNETLIPELGQSLYEEKAKDGNYHVKVLWNNNMVQTDFNPNGLNVLELTIRNGIMELQEITD